MSSVDDSTRAAAMFDALLALSQSLTGAHPGAMLEGALGALLTATGCARGAAYATVGDSLALVGERGLPAELRPSLQRLALAESPWFIAQQAARARGFIAGRVVAALADSACEEVLAASGWLQAMACPIVVEHRVEGVLVIATPGGELGAPALATLQLACNLLALQIARGNAEHRLHEYRRGDARAARLAAFGLLVGGFAGELEPAIAAIERGLVEQQQLIGRLRRRIPLGNSDGERLAEVAASTVSAAGIVRERAARLLTAVRPGSEAERLDLGRVVDDALTLLAAVLRSSRVELRVCCPEGHLVVGRRGELMQLVLHAVLNLAGALDESNALGERGDARTRCVEVEVHAEDAHVVLSLTDSSDDVASARARLLASPATMNAGDQGVGLALARQIVIAHHGHIELGPASGAGGVRCDIVLPRAAAEADVVERSASSPGAPPARPKGVRPSILWVDGDDLSSEIAAQALADCEVHRARTAAEATQLLFKFGAPPSLIFCNVRLPDRPGPELHADIAGFSPELAARFVFHSDGVLSKDVASYLVASGRATLMRPIGVEQIRALAFAESGAPIRSAAPTLTPPLRPVLPAHAPAPAPPGPASAADRITAADLAASRAASGRSTAAEPAASRTATGRIAGAPASVARPDVRMAPTEPMLAAARPPDGVSSDRYQTLRSSGAAPPRAVAGAPASPIRERPHVEALSLEQRGARAGAPAMRDQQLSAVARATAALLLREGPKRGPVVLEMLRGRGLSESEALSVVMYALSTGALVRDPPWSTMLKAREPKPIRTVLVVDDDPDLRQALREVLEDDGYTVETAGNGRQALEVLRRRATPPQVVVLDMMMPVMDGWEFLHEVRQDAAFVNIPIMVLSAAKQTRAADEFLSKPVDYYQLLATVERLARSRAAS